MDIAMDLTPNSPSHGDILLVGGNIIATSDANPQGTNFVMQSILQRLRTFLGEWFMDNTLGTPYFQRILIKGATVEEVELAMSDVILGTPGVLSIVQLSANYTAATRNIALTFVASSTAGPISYSGPVGYATQDTTS